MQELRCTKCKRLLCRYDVYHGIVEIKCPWCNTFTTAEFNIINDTTKLLELLEIAIK